MMVACFSRQLLSDLATPLSVDCAHCRRGHSLAFPGRGTFARRGHHPKTPSRTRALADVPAWAHRAA